MLSRRDAIKLAIAGALSPLLSLLPERDGFVGEPFYDVSKMGPAKVELSNFGIINNTGRDCYYALGDGEPVWIPAGERRLLPLPVQKEARND